MINNLRTVSEKPKYIGINTDAIIRAVMQYNLYFFYIRKQKKPRRGKKGRKQYFLSTAHINTVQRTT